MSKPQTIASQKQLDLIAKLLTRNRTSSASAEWHEDILGSANCSDPLPLTKLAASCLIDKLFGKDDDRPRLAAWSIRTWREEDPDAYEAEYERMAAGAAAFDASLKSA